MRCGHPSTGEGIRDALAAGAERAIALPLYPQCANATTTQLAPRDAPALAAARGPLFEVCTYHDHPGYLDASAAALREAIARVPPEHRDRCSWSSAPTAFP